MQALVLTLIYLVSLSGSDFLHSVERRAGLEPVDLLVVQRMVELDAVGAAVFVLNFAVHWL